MTTQTPITRADAKRLGLKHYFTGKPCPKGHTDVRFVSTGGCKACCTLATMAAYKHKTARRRAYNDRESFIAAASAKHENRYGYELVQYVNAHALVDITCHIHGVFKQNPTNHIQGKGCPSCSATATGVRSRGTQAGFIQSATAVWGVGTFDYSQVVYDKAHSEVTIICPTHGPFITTPTNHLSGAQSCTKCNHMKSKGEEAVFRLCSIYTPAQSRVYPFPNDRRELDIYAPERKLAVEYSGMRYHTHWAAEAEKKDKNKHYQKYVDCKALGIRLITMYESEWLGHNYAVRRLLRNALGKGKGKLMARKCELKKVEHAAATAFYDRYHPQGGAGSGVHYGLFWKGKLVACMRFVLGANDRGAGATNRVWTLGRYATRITVAGAASRLFKAFVAEHNPPMVKSFSDNRYFEGGMYEQLGFTLDEETPPDYQVWHPKLGLRPKSHYQRRQLPARLKEVGSDISFDPETDPRTEAEMTYLMGAGRIYDCGKKRWLWTPTPQP